MRIRALLCLIAGATLPLITGCRGCGCEGPEDEGADVAAAPAESQPAAPPVEIVVPGKPAQTGSEVSLPSTSAPEPIVPGQSDLPSVTEEDLADPRLNENLHPVAKRSIKMLEKYQQLHPAQVVDTGPREPVIETVKPQ